MQETPKDFYVYIHRKATNGEVFYVGKGVGRRAWVKERGNLHWQNTVQKHNYIVEIVQDGLQEWYAFELEKNLIAYYGRADCGIGNLVNHTDGGDGVSSEDARKNSLLQWENPTSREKLIKSLNASRKEGHMAMMQAAAQKDEAKAKRAIGISKAKTGKPLSEKAKAARRGKNVGDANPMRKPEIVEKLTGWNSSRSKPVICIPTGNIYSGALKAAQSIGISDSCIRDVVNGKRKTAGGHTWRYATQAEIDAHMSSKNVI
jgi:hypothetical protein